MIDAAYWAGQGTDHCELQLQLENGCLGSTFLQMPADGLQSEARSPEKARDVLRNFV